MKLIRYYFLVVIFLLMLMNHSESAAGSNCSYSKSVHLKGTTFDIISRPADGCAVQIVTVTARRSGKKTAVTKADVDYLARLAQAVDLTGDGLPELALISRAAGDTATEALDVYWLDGKSLRRSIVPELEDKNGYKGGDRFRIEGRQIVRTIPVYRDGDPAGKPTGGTRMLKYDFKDGALTPGSWIPIESEEKTLAGKPDYLLILPWNLKDEIIAQNVAIRAWGGRFVVPIPHLQVIE